MQGQAHVLDLLVILLGALAIFGGIFHQPRRPRERH
jgi:hypothetical protein